MEGEKEKFISLIKELLQNEEKYEETLEELNHLNYLFYSFWKENEHKRHMAQYNCNNYKSTIEDLNKKLGEITLDDEMKDYFSLYLQKSQLIKDSWKLKTEIGYIHSTLIFDAGCTLESDRKNSEKKKKLEKDKVEVDRKIQEVTEKMNALYQ